MESKYNTTSLFLDQPDPEDGGSKLLGSELTICQLTYCHMSEDLNLHQHHCQNLKSCIVQAL